MNKQQIQEHQKEKKKQELKFQSLSQRTFQMQWTPIRGNSQAMDGEQAQHIMMQYLIKMAFTKRPSRALQQEQHIISYQQQEITSCDTQQARKKVASEKLSSMQEQKHGSRSSWKRETPLNQEQQRQTCHTYSQHKKIRFLCITKSMDSFYFKSSLRSSAQSPQGSTKN